MGTMAQEEETVETMSLCRMMNPRLLNDLAILAVHQMMEMTQEMDFGVKRVNINKWANHT